MENATEVVQLILRERQGRDRGWWSQMGECFHPDSTVRVSWFTGSGADFVSGSERLKESGGTWPIHRVCTPVVHLQGSKAVAEASVEICVRFTLHDVEADLHAYVRLVYEAERRGEDWKICRLNSIYERDFLAPVVPDASLEIDRSILDGFREPFRWIGYQSAVNGRELPDDLYGDDRPEEVDALYQRAFDWLNS